MNKLRSQIVNFMQTNSIFQKGAILLLLTYLLTGCSGDRCIDADDFGFSKFTISSRYSLEELSLQTGNNQIAPWRDSHFRVNGRPLTIVVKTWKYKDDYNRAGDVSAWCPWYGEAKHSKVLSPIAVRLQPCQFVNNQMCTATKDARITNAPCIFKNGVGLYMLIAKRDTDPNESFITQRSPEGITAHLGEPLNGYKLYDISRKGLLRDAGGIVYKYDNAGNSSNLKEEYADSKLYFKILDKFYDDNSGQYKIYIKSGISDTRDDPIEFLTNLVKKSLFGTGDNPGLIRNIYSKLTENSGYRMSVQALLCLYVMFTALSFLTGNINITHTELIIRIVKVAIVSALLSSKWSWTFFNDYLFVYFIGGVEQAIGIIKEAGASGPGSTSILKLMLAPQTLAKLFSVLFIDWLGFIYIILFICALYFLIIIVFEAAIIYLMALISIGLIITMGPIFVCFMLFQVTRSLFDNWLKFLISYALQPLILFTGIVFISLIIRTEIYSTLGFKTCKYDFPNLANLSDIFGGDGSNLDAALTNSIFYWWFPSPMKGEDFTKVKANIPVPVDHFKEDGTFCEAYGCFEERYIELPFLDPAKDKDRLNSFFQGKFVHLDGLLLIFIAIYLLSKFNAISVSIAKFLTNTSVSYTNIQGIGSAAFAPIEQTLLKPISYIEDGVRSVADRVFEPLSSKAATSFENWKVKSLENEAIDINKANRTVLDEVKRNYGMDIRDLKKDAIKDYKEGIKDAIKSLGGNAEEKAIEKAVENLSQKTYAELKDSLASIKFGAKSTYDALDQAQKAIIDNALKGSADKSSLKELASDIAFTRDFQKAYIDSYEALSSKGVGLFGKNIGILKSWQELKADVHALEELKQHKKMNFVEQLYSEYAGVKRSIATKLLGEKLTRSLEGSLTQAQWHDFDYNDPRLRTYSEILKDRDLENSFAELKASMNRETIKAKDDVFKPENLVKLENLGNTETAKRYDNLSKEALSMQIHFALSSGKDPALMGDKFMQEKATDSQSKAMIDKAYKVADELINNDRYIRREAHYEVMYDKAMDSINKQYDFLSEQFKRDDITLKEMPVLLKDYYKDRGEEATPEAIDAMQKLETSIKNLDYSKRVLEKLDERKEFIRNEVDKHINGINKHRKNSKMSEYTQEDKSVEPRAFKSFAGDK